MDEMRDAEIGRLLSGGQVAEHEDDYWDALREAVAPELEALSRPRPRRRRFLHMGLAAAAVAAAAVVAFAVLPALRGTDTATAADMLASMNAASSDVQTVRLRVVEGFLGSPDDSPPPASPQPASIAAQAARLHRKTITDLILSTNGDFRASQATEGPTEPDTYPGETLAYPGQYGYDASRHELRIDSRNTGDGVMVLRPAWPTGFPANDVYYLTYQDEANSVRAQLAEADPEMPVTEITYLGRPAWTTSLRYYEWPNVERRVTVDKATGLLLAIDVVGEQPGGDELISSLRVTRLEVDPDLQVDWEVVPLLEKTRAFMRWNYFHDDGTRFGSPESVATRSLPTPPLIPQWAPPGYRRSAIATAVFDDPRPAHWDDNSRHYKHEGIPPKGSTPGTGILKRLALKRCKQKVLVQFRRGFDTFTITISPRVPGEEMVDERSAASPNGRDVTLTGGYLKGATARTWLSSADYRYRSWDGKTMSEDTQGPTLLAYDDRWKVVISGGLTRQELVDVANSLKTYGD